MTTMRARPASPAAWNSRRVPISMPAAALTTITAVSTAGSAASAWPISSGAPGVSIRLIWRPAVVPNSRLELVEWWWARASGSKSLTVVASVTLPVRLIAPQRWRTASASVVLPAPVCPSRTMLQSASGWKPGCLLMRRLYAGSRRGAGV